MRTKLFLIVVGLMIGNFVAESFNDDPNFIRTMDITFAQGWALFTYWFCETYFWKDK